MARGYITSGIPTAKGGAPILDRPYSINDSGVVRHARESRPIEFVKPVPGRLHTWARPDAIVDGGE